MRTLLAFALLTLPAIAAPVPKELKQSPRDRLQGKWVIVSLDSGGGQQVQTGDFAGFTLTIDGDKLSTATTTGAGYRKVTVVYDFDSRPMRVDVKTETSTTPGRICRPRPSSSAAAAATASSGSEPRNKAGIVSGGVTTRPGAPTILWRAMEFG